MRPALVILPLVALAACATPRESCINNVTRESRVLESLISETRGNLSRGYALEEEQRVRTLRRTCEGQTESGEEFSYRCDRTRTIETTRPVAIDLDAERAKLASLEQRQAQNRENVDQAIAQCIAAYPE